jgi:thioredoxin reductase (NADPH)
MSRPAIVVLDDEADELQRIGDELEKRYCADYDVLCMGSVQDALNCLESYREQGLEIPVLLVDLWMPEMSGVEFLARARSIYPEARRCLMVHWGDRSAAPPVLQAMSHNEIQSFLSKPSGPADEGFHRFITEALYDWQMQRKPSFEMVRILGSRLSPRCHELRDLFERNSIPHGFYDQDSDRGRALMREFNLDASTLPLAIMPDGKVVIDPSNAELGDALQDYSLLEISSPVENRTFDVVIVGAGPAGLSAAVYCASEGLETLVLEREAIGGQAGTSSLIRNYMGFPTGVSGADLAMRAYRQAWLFGAHYLFGREAVALERKDGCLFITLSDKRSIKTKALILGVGMAYRRLGIPDLEKYIGAGVYYGAAVSESRAMKGHDVYIAGGGNSGGQAASHLAKYAQKVTIVEMLPDLAANMSDYLVREIYANEKIHLRLNSRVTGGGGDHRLRWLEIQDNLSGEIERMDARALFVMIGARPNTHWLPESIARDERGYVLTDQDLLKNETYLASWDQQRDPFPMETSLPGVFAAGDVRCGSVKRVASAVGAGSIVVQYVHRYLANWEAHGG